MRYSRTYENATLSDRPDRRRMNHPRARPPPRPLRTQAQTPRSPTPVPPARNRQRYPVCAGHRLSVATAAPRPAPVEDRVYHFRRWQQRGVWAQLEQVLSTQAWRQAGLALPKPLRWRRGGLGWRVCVGWCAGWRVRNARQPLTVFTCLLLQRREWLVEYFGNRRRLLPPNNQNYTRRRIHLCLLAVPPWKQSAEQPN